MIVSIIGKIFKRKSALTVYYERSALHVPFLALRAHGLILVIIGARPGSAVIRHLLGLGHIDLFIEFSTNAESIHVALSGISAFLRQIEIAWQIIGVARRRV